MKTAPPPQDRHLRAASPVRLLPGSGRAPPDTTRNDRPVFRSRPRVPLRRAMSPQKFRAPFARRPASENRTDKAGEDFLSIPALRHPSAAKISPHITRLGWIDKQTCSPIVEDF